MPELVIRNYTEEMVRAYVDQNLPKEDVCDCDRCKLDVIAYMLNHLPASYGITHRGYLFDKMKEMDMQKRVTISDCFYNAVVAVKKRPSDDCSTQIALGE